MRQYLVAELNREGGQTSLSVTRRGAGTVAAVSGDWDLGTIDELRTVLYDAVADSRHLVVDLTAVRFIDSSTLGVLVGTRKRVLAAGGTLTLVCRAPRTLRLFELTALDRLFTIVPSMDHWQPS
jgi:anti-sigma B factor antagonist